MDPFARAASRIIIEQQSIIGPIALEQAKKVVGLQLAGVEVQITGNKKEVLGNLVKQFAKLFGQASIEVCKEAFQTVADKIPSSEVPEVLKS